jgi:hypothetical protein
MKIYDIAKVVSGNVLGIGVDGEISEILEQNERVTECNLLNSYSFQSKEENKKQKLKKIRVKKIRKVFKKKKVNFIICNITEIKKYLKTFVKDSIYINKEILYIYNIEDEELKKELIKKYKRYNTNIEEIKNKKTTILKIDNSKAKTNIFKDNFYLIVDTLVKLFNIISDLLLN